MEQMRVLLIDDNENDLDLARHDLEAAGFAVTTSDRIDDALELARRTPPQVIVSDLGLPGQDGYSVPRRVRQDPRLRNVPVIALTGAQSHVALSRARDFNAVMQKPISPQELLAHISRFRTNGENYADEIDVRGPGGMRFRARGTDIIALVTVLGIGAMLAMVWNQGEESKRGTGAVVETNKQVAEAIRENSSAIRGMEKASRLQTCLLATEQDRRSHEYMAANSYCNRMQ